MYFMKFQKFCILCSDTAASLSGANPVNADAYAYFSSENNTYGVVGIGFVGSVCAPVSFKKYRTTITEYTNDDPTTAEVYMYMRPFQIYDIFICNLDVSEDIITKTFSSGAAGHIEERNRLMFIFDEIFIYFEQLFDKLYKQTIFVKKH